MGKSKILQSGGGKPYTGSTTITPSTSQTTIPAGTLLKDGLTIKAVPTETKSVTPSASGQTVTPTSGKFLSQVTVSGDSDLKAANVKKGVNIFGVTGSLEGCASGTATFQNKTQTLSINHNLGVKPRGALIVENDFYPGGESDASNEFHLIAMSPAGKFFAYRKYFADSSWSNTSYFSKMEVTSTKIELIGINSNFGFRGSYSWFVW